MEAAIAKLLKPICRTLQITLPKKIADAFGLKKGTMFDIHVKKNKIELSPLEIKPKSFTQEEYKKLDLLFEEEKGKAKRVSKRFISKLKQGKI